jgi:3-carboxy-cis,cis-muconate cycloisomerase
MNRENPPRLLDPMFTTEKMREIFSDRGRLDGMLRFEAALARAEARVGVISKFAPDAIESLCRAELFDIEKLGRAAALAGNLAIPLVQELTARVAQHSREAADFVHYGATSQDAMDTGLVLQLRDALDAIEADLTALAGILAELASVQKKTVLAGRTWMQQAIPVTFGLKAGGWLSAVERHRARMGELRPRILVLQFGGAAGTLAALENNGLKIAEALGEELGLSLPDVPWHAHRDRVAEVATTLGLLVGTLGKIARDITLLMQTEIGEAFEPAAEGRGGSSTLPQKRNPVGCAAVLSAAVRVPALVSVMLAAMVQENERGMGNWHAEWETLPEICALASGALMHITQVIKGLELDANRMTGNLEVTRGQVLAEAISMALAKKTGRPQAKRLVEQACRKASAEGRHLREILAETPEVREHLSARDLDGLFNPENYLGVAEELVDRALQVHSKNSKPDPS